MAAFIGVFSFFGLLAWISNVIKKNPVKSTRKGIAVCFVLVVVCLAVTPSNANSHQADSKVAIESERITTSKGEETTTSNTVEIERTLEEADQGKKYPYAINYDELQKMFLTFNFDTTEGDLIKMIEDSNLKYTAQKYNGSPKKLCYKIAYEQDAASQKHAKSGDYIEICFSMSDGSFMYAEYFNNHAFKIALFYNYGTHWEFRESEANNQYSGFYYYKPGEGENGITIKYSNGNSTETGYHNVSAGEEALSGVLN